MAEKQEEVMEEVTKNPDLSLSVLMNKPYKQLEEEILKDKESLCKVGIDERHVRVLTFRILCKNADAIEKFNKISILLTFVILTMMVVQVIVAVYK